MYFNVGCLVNKRIVIFYQCLFFLSELGFVGSTLRGCGLFLVGYLNF